MSLTGIRFIPVRIRISRRGRLSWVTPTGLKQRRLIPFWFLHLTSLSKASPNKNGSFYTALHNECTDSFSWLLFYILAKNSTFHRSSSFWAHEAAMLIIRLKIARYDHVTMIHQLAFSSMLMQSSHQSTNSQHLVLLWRSTTGWTSPSPVPELSFLPAP